MQALKDVDPEIAEQVRIAGRSFSQLTPCQRKEWFEDRLTLHAINLDALPSHERGRHDLAQKAVIGYRAVQATSPSFTIWDAVLTILCDAHGGTHGSELLRSREFNAVLRIYYP